MSVLPAGFGSGVGAAPVYPIEHSVRFRALSSASLNRIFASGGSTTTWTWAGWVKRGFLGTDQQLFCRNPASNYQTCAFYAAAAPVDSINLQLYTSPTPIANLFSNALFRDPSAWYHIVIVWDSSNAAIGDRWRLYVNGVREALTGTYPPLNTAGYLNTAGVHTIGALNNGTGQLFDGLLAEHHFIDAQALDPSEFGQFNSDGVWTPKTYSGTYGTTGYYLPFNDGSTLVNLTLDRSGNGNNWTTSNISLASGAAYDWTTDTPTDNYAVLNSALNFGQYAHAVPASTAGTINNANLRVQGPTSAWSGWISTVLPSTGKWYWEVSIFFNTTNLTGIVNPLNTTRYPSSSPTVALNDVLGYALDRDAGTFSWYRNNVFQATLVTGLTGEWYPFTSVANGGITEFNFGQRPFAYAPPAGFLALRTSNLPSAPITKGNEQFDVALYTGNQTARNITGFAFRPDLVWLKARSTALREHTLFDVNRGATKYLVSNSTSQEVTVAQSLTSFNSDGFSLGTGVDANENGQTFVGWAWKANGAGSTNTAGSITSTVSANTTAGISVITYTGTGANATVGHGLGVAPALLIVKRRDTAGFNWVVWQSVLLGTEYLLLESTNARATAQPTVWNSTVPASTVFSVGTSTATNASGGTYVAYCFAEVPGFSKFKQYTGNGIANGPFVYCGFRPRYILIKCSSAGGTSWVVKDTARSPVNVALANLYPNLTNVEDATAALAIDTLSNGFKIRGTDSQTNTNAATYIYIAFAENPFGGDNVSPVNAR